MNRLILHQRGGFIKGKKPHAASINTNLRIYIPKCNGSYILLQDSAITFTNRKSNYIHLAVFLL